MTDLDLDKIEASMGGHYGVTDPVVHALIASLRATREAKERAEERAVDVNDLYARTLSDCGREIREKGLALARAESAERALAEMTRERDEAMREMVIAARNERDALAAELREAREAKASADAMYSIALAEHGATLREKGLAIERAEKAERERDELVERMEIVLRAGPSTALAASVFDRAIRAERALADVTRERDALKGERDELVGRLRARTRLLAESRAGRGVPEEVREALLGLVEDARESGLTTWPTIVEAWLDAEPQPAVPDLDPIDAIATLTDAQLAAIEPTAFAWSCLGDGRCPETCATCHPDLHPKKPEPDRFAEGWAKAIEAAVDMLFVGEDGDDPEYVFGAYHALRTIRALRPKGER